LAKRRFGRVKRRSSTLTYGDATFHNETYTVYGRRGGLEDRLIFPQDPEFLKAPMDAKFTITYRGRKYGARKTGRTVLANGARVIPGLIWVLD